MPGKVPEDKKAVYYINFSSPEGYKDLIIKSLSNNNADNVLPQFENLKISQS